MTIFDHTQALSGFCNNIEGRENFESGLRGAGKEHVPKAEENAAPGSRPCLARQRWKALVAQVSRHLAKNRHVSVSAGLTRLR